VTRVVVTGAAGFIGMHVSRRLLDRGHAVLGVDSLTPYYDVSLKERRLALLGEHPGFAFERVDLAHRQAAEGLFRRARADRVVHLAAQPGVRHSLEDPHAYVDSNITGFLNVLEGCRQHPVRHLVYASSSSVYGGNIKIPFSVTDAVDRPVSLYAATKRANELMAYTYSHLFGIPATGLRFFTVYGPWGRPDMAPLLFTKAIFEGRPIRVFNGGDMRRDFTYVDDIAEGVLRVLDSPASVEGGANHRVYNIGSGAPVELLRFIAMLETEIGLEARLESAPMQPGDVQATFADVADLERDFGFRPTTGIEDGVRRLVAWYREYHRPRSAPIT
jgi:UDP-glucuronate 4-epimerase